MMSVINFLVKKSPSSLKKIGYMALFRRRKIKDPGPFVDVVRGRHGLEIGGPSIFFDLSLPLYRHAASIDGANFSQETLWEKQIDTTEPYKYFNKRFGSQLILEATNLSVVDSEKYDFILSCHSLEHVANPLKALREWHRVLKIDGSLVIAVPNKDAIFDHRREVTPFSHLQQDEELETEETDLSHLAEILEFHDLSRDKAAGSFEDFVARSLDNANIRGLHHHVFDSETIAKCIETAGFTLTLQNSSYYDHLLLCQKR
jgi:SAM-dependent methyltransferase